MEATSKSRIRTLAVAFAGACAFLSLYATQPLLPTLERLFQVGKTAVSLTVTASTLGVAMAAPLVGTVADRFGRKRVIVASAVSLAAATLLNCTAHSLTTLVVWRFLQGVFTPGVFVATVAYVQEEWLEGGGGSAMAAYVTGTVLGGFIGRMTAGLIVAHWDWHWVFVTLGALGGVGALSIQGLLPKERNFSRRRQSMITSLAAHMSNRQLLATYAAGFCVLFSLLSTFTYVTFYLAAPPFRLGPAALGWLFFVYLVGAAITPPSGRGIDRFGHRAVFAVAMGVSMGGVFLTLLPSLVAVTAGLALCCSGVFVAQAAANSYIGLAANGNKALAVGLYVTCYYLGGSTGAEVPGFLWRFGGWPACVALIVVVQAATIAITRIGWNRTGRTGRPQQTAFLPVHS
jgi:MFS transporter, YNFM family, putative membrane transport protein